MQLIQQTRESNITVIERNVSVEFLTVEGTVY